MADDTIRTPAQQEGPLFEGKDRFIGRLALLLATHEAGNEALAAEAAAGEPSADRMHRFNAGIVRGVAMCGELVKRWQVTPRAEPASPDPVTRPSADGSALLRRWRVEGVIYAPDRASAELRAKTAQVSVDRLDIAEDEPR